MRFCFKLVITGVFQFQLSLQDPRGKHPAMAETFGNSSVQDDTHAGDDINPSVDPRLRGRNFWRPGPGTGTNSDWGFCSASAPCSAAQGDCDDDSHCKGSLKCGKNNCKDFHANARSSADCCIEIKSGSGFLGWSFCKQYKYGLYTSPPCGVGQGDCDNDSECGKGLKCGTDNCQDFDPFASRFADCCYKCGITRKTRIVGGQATEVNEYPWITLLNIVRNGKSYRCGGSLIASEWVVTAAHCVFHENQVASGSMITVILGEHDTTTQLESKIPRKEVKVTKVIPHDVQLDLENDIALLKLAEKIDLNTYTPVCLPKSGDDFTGKTALTYGWGRVSTYGPLPSTLQEVAVKIVSDQTCQAAFDAFNDPYTWTITSSMVCAGGVGGKDSCSGDSGGPLSLAVKNQHTLAGIVSWGHPSGCALANMYGVYAETAKFSSWLDTTMASNGGMAKCPA